MNQCKIKIENLHQTLTVSILVLLVQTFEFFFFTKMNARRILRAKYLPNPIDVKSFVLQTSNKALKKPFKYLVGSKIVV